MSQDSWKRAAAARALGLVQPGMRLGLGTGSTAAHFVELLGGEVAAGLRVVCVPTSEATRAQAERLAIPLSTLEELGSLDLTVDGTDEIDDALQLVKGGGGALLREKIVAFASARMVVIADVGKRVATLGAFPLPVEIVTFGWTATRDMIEAVLAEAGFSGSITLRHGKDGRPFLTDSGNLVLDCALGAINDAELLDSALKVVPGVVEHGLFLGVADIALIGGPSGVEQLSVDRDEGDRD